VPADLCCAAAGAARSILIFSFAGIASLHNPGLCCCFALLQVRGADIFILTCHSTAKWFDRQMV
jgi:hypothetical protein